MSTETALQSNKVEQEAGLANAPTKKKIGFFAAMMVVVGSAIGAGIFFKAGSVLTGSQGSIVFAMFCWLFGAFAVIAMGLALIEIASARNDNLSMIGWCKTFNGRVIYKACKNFMFYVYLPLTYFFMPLYVIMSFQDGIASIYAQEGLPYNGMGTSGDWAILMSITIGVSIYFIVVCGLSSRAGSIQNAFILAFKFLPLIFAAILGFVVIGVNAAQGVLHNPGNGAMVAIAGDYDAGFVPSPTNTPSNTFSYTDMTPGVGMFIAIGGIFFAFDGFYVAAGVQSDMKEPKKTPYALLGGLIIVTIVYLTIAISMSLGSVGGGAYGYSTFLFSKGKSVAWLYSTFQILIAVGVLGIINGFALWSTRFTEDLIKANELPLSVKYVNKIREDGKAIVGIVYNLVISLPIVVVFCLIGGLGYINNNDSTGMQLCTVSSLVNTLGTSVRGDYVGTLVGTNMVTGIPNAFTGAWLGTPHVYMLDPVHTKAWIESNFNAQGNIFISGGYINYFYGAGVGKLYSFCNLMATWTSVAAFTFILCALFGAIKNRKTHKVKVVKSKFFLPMAISAVITMILPIFFTFFQPIMDMFFLYRIPNLGGANKDELVSRIMTVVVLLLYVGLMFLPTWIEDGYLKAKFGSVEAGEEHKIRAMAAAKGVSAEEEVIWQLVNDKVITMNEAQANVLGRPLTKDEIKAIQSLEVNDDNATEDAEDTVSLSDTLNQELAYDNVTVAAQQPVCCQAAAQSAFNAKSILSYEPMDDIDYVTLKDVFLKKEQEKANK